MTINQTLTETFDDLAYYLQQGNHAEALVLTPKLMQIYLAHLAKHDLPGIEAYGTASAGQRWWMASVYDTDVIAHLNEDAEAIFFALDYTYDDCGILQFDDRNPRNWACLLKAVDIHGGRFLQSFAHTLAEHRDRIPFRTAWAVVVGAVYHDIALYSMFN